ncbi:hypothetical protein ABZT06_44910 [Streptomyces sp. NPDC005483]|uniref:hypothetical protein n=1 Tax=Streptomyces sp. NPDC005483 TaxID=3154882 RepID=UPI0033A85FC6
MNLTEKAKISSGASFVSGFIGILGLALVTLGAVQGIGRLWAHLEIQLWAVPGLAPALVLVIGALLIAGSFYTFSRRSFGTPADDGR